MAPSRRLVVLAAALVAAIPALYADGGTTAPAVPPPSNGVTCYYTMTVRLRPFLLWMTWDDVGGARMSWSRSTGPDRWLELLVGSDPQRSPRSINRWGFISEQTQDGTTQLTGIMSDTDDRSIDAARSTGPEAMKDGHVFRAVQSTVRDNQATTSIGRLVVESDLTYRHYGTLLQRLPAGGSTVRRTTVEAGVAPGFLMAMKDLVHDSVEKWRQAPRSMPDAVLRRDYVYAGKAYRLSLRHAVAVDDATVGGRSRGPAINGEFEILNVASAEVTTFRMLYGVSGAEAEVPLHVVYRPRWWVELEITIDNDPSNRFALANLSPAGPPWAAR